MKQNLIPKQLTNHQISMVYANEADVLNVVLFGITAKEWRDKNRELKENVRDYVSINELIILSNLENLNAVFLNQGIAQKDRLTELNKNAIHQMSVLQNIAKKEIIKLKL